MLEYKQLTRLQSSQVPSREIRLTFTYIHSPQKHPFHSGCLSHTIEQSYCAIYRSLLVIHFKYNSVYMPVPNSLTLSSLHLAMIFCPLIVDLT